MREGVKEALQAKFLPEFLNRIDDQIIFHPLKREQIRKIADLQVNHLVGQLADRGIRLEVSEAARALISTLGYDPTFGARPLRRVIQQQLQNPLATEILRGGIDEKTGIRVDAKSGEFVFAKTTG